jgi:hypothetical protein
VSAGASRHPLVTTLEQLDSLDNGELVEGYMAAERGDPEPGTNHSLAYCHGWRSRMYDLREIPTPPEHYALTRDYVARARDQHTLSNLRPRSELP